MNLLTELRLLFRLRGQLVKNDVTHLTKEKVLKFALLAGLGSVFFTLDYLFFHRIIAYVARIDILDLVEVGTLVVARLLNMIFLIFFSMLLFSNVVIALATFYLSSDLGLLLSSPLRFASIFTVKFVETMLNSSLMLIIFGLPIFIACGQEYHASYLYYLAIPATLLPFIVIPATIGVTLTMLLVRFFPVKRVQQVLTVFGLILGAGLVMLFRFLRPEQLINNIEEYQLLAFLKMIRIPTAPYLPSAWATNVLMALLDQSNPTPALWNLLWLFLGASGVYLVALRLAQAIYYPGWAGAAESRTVKMMPRLTWSEPLLRRMTFLHATTRALLLKDIKLFWRDTTQWSQLLMLAALLLVYFFNIKSLPINSAYLKNLISFLNLGMAGFVLASIGARFVYPSTSLEGQSFWVIHSAPIQYRRFLLEKFLIFLFPLLILAETLIIISNLLLDVNGYMMLLSVVTIFLITVGLTGLGVGMGAIYPKFINENPAQIAMSVGGILYMIFSLLYIGATIILEAWPVYVYFSQQLFSHAVRGKELGGLYLAYALVCGLSLAVTVIPLYLGVKRLQAFEIV